MAYRSIENKEQADACGILKTRRLTGEEGAGKGYAKISDGRLTHAPLPPE